MEKEEEQEVSPAGDLSETPVAVAERKEEAKSVLVLFVPSYNLGSSCSERRRPLRSPNSRAKARRPKKQEGEERSQGYSQKR